MKSSEHERHETDASTTDGSSTRRRFLKGTAAAGIAAAGVSATATSTSAQLWGGTSGGADSGGVGGTDPESATAPTFDVGGGFGGASELPNSSESELVIYLHGATAGNTANEQGGELRVRLGNAGYDTTVVSGVFSEGDVSIGDSTGSASDHLAGLIEDYKDSTGGTVHIVGYSLGGILTYQTVNSLGSGYTVQTAASLGTGTPDSTFCEGNAYYDGLTNNAENVCILISDNDSAVSGMSGGDTGCGGLFGGGSEPPNMDIIDVTSEVDSHLVYLDSSLVHEELASCFEQSTGTGGTSATSGTSGTGETSGTSGTSGTGETSGGLWGSDGSSDGTSGGLWGSDGSSDGTSGGLWGSDGSSDGTSGGLWGSSGSSGGTFGWF